MDTKSKDPPTAAVKFYLKESVLAGDQDFRMMWVLRRPEFRAEVGDGGTRLPGPWVVRGRGAS